MANRIYKTPVVSKSGAVYTRETSHTGPDGEVVVTAWTDNAWNRAQEANRRYLADLEWQRAHPYLAGLRRFAGGVGDFINDEIFLNKGNVRVKNAQAHPQGLEWFRLGGNQAVALLGLGTAPMWAPELAAALPTLSGAGEGSLLSTAIPQVTSRTAPQLANMLNWSMAGLGTYTLGRALSENAPTFSTPSFSLPQFGSATMATATTPTDSVGTAPAQPAPADTTGTVAPGTTAPAPQPERNDSTSQGRRPSFRERLGDRIAGRSSGLATGNSGGATPPNNNQNGSFIGRMLWETKNNNFGQNYWQWRNVGRVGLGLSYPAREHLWPAVGSAGKYMIMGPDSIPATPTPAATNTPSAPVDSSYVAKDQYVAPTDTLDF